MKIQLSSTVYQFISFKLPQVVVLCLPIFFGWGPFKYYENMVFLRTICGLAIIISSARCLPLVNHFNLVQQPSFFESQQLQAHPIPGILYPDVSRKDLSHPAVVRNAEIESHYAPELLNDFYKNPAIASRLAKESWFTNKEFPVYHREADKISRQKIYEVIDRIVH
ncbi:hypothetical protein WA026_014498 [Henosepilachna vigintioctopunctata]|uniref:Uncharacterized protein n=1 Tax=Henosepilachna vigintioctopunctata TaxID=420089 RepID=A0AAW1UMW5_9CUCU